MGYRPSAPKWVVTKYGKDNFGDLPSKDKVVAVYTKEEKARSEVIKAIEKEFPESAYTVFDRSYNDPGGLRKNKYVAKLRGGPHLYSWESVPLNPDLEDL